MQAELTVLIGTAITISCLHTLTGPDHYLPFIALAKTRNWSVKKTLWWTIACGCGHVWSSVLLGLGGAAVGWSLSKVNGFENVRGGIAGWVLVCFGLGYCIWGMVKAYRGARHKHFELNNDGSMYVYEHTEAQLVSPADRHAVTPWVMFLIFVLGPCEPMIPLLYFPAAKSSWYAIIILVLVYTLFTLLTMVVMVLIGLFGFTLLRTGKMEKYVHAIGGATILVCGVGMIFLEW
jgi:sulfite exporter TauE/SafE